MDGPHAIGLATALALLLTLSPVAALPVAAPTTAEVSTSTVSTSPVAATSAAQTSPVVRSDNTTSYLALPATEIERSTFGTVGLDVGGATAVDQTSLESRYLRLRLIEAFSEASSEDERRAVVEETFEHLRSRVDTLERRERAALSAYNDGDISTRAYLRELAAVDAGADSLSPTIGQLYEFTESMSRSPIKPRELAALKVRLLGLRGPVRNRVARAMQGDVDATRVYVETSRSGVVLATVVGREFDRQYVREAYLPSARDTVAPDQFLVNGQHDLEAAERRARELYPWAFDNQGGFSSGVRTGQPYLYLASAYSMAIDHPHGTARQGDLVTYIDGGTTNVFREVQYKDVSEIPTTPPATNASRAVSDGLLLQVNRTREGGPLEIRVRQASSRSPTSAMVLVDGEPIGGTGTDGRIWTISPRRAFNVTAMVGNRTVTAGPMFPREQFQTTSGS